MTQWAWTLLAGAATLVILLAIFVLGPQINFHWNSGSPSMKSSTGITTCAFTGVLNITNYRHESLAPSPLPKSHAASDGEQIIELFQNLGRSTIWKSIANISFEGDTFEPEGMVRLSDDRYVVSCGEYTEHTEKYDGIINGTDRTAGNGFAHLMVYNGKGERIADASITKNGETEYHNGGIDFDGEFIWGTIGQYRPNSTAYVYRTDPMTLKPERILHYDDHLGGIVHDTQEHTITSLNWGARNATTWNLRRAETGCGAAPKPKSIVRNPTYFVDYQDCKWLGHSKFYSGKSVMLCSGVAKMGGYNLGGVALVDVATMNPLAEVPITLQSALGVRLTQNPVDVSVEDGKFRIYWMPDQHNSTLYVYEAQPNSPFKYGGGR
ncbi:Fc.00g096680.m01.CDS01 [Cosmosporella sp. VM-42]